MAELPQIGDRIAARYRVDSSLGVGGMGAVYACTDQTSGRSVAIKWLKPELADDERALARFLAEAKRLGQVDHPNVVGVLDAATDPATGAPFLVMERLRGESLKERLRRGALSELEAVAIGLAAARGLAEAHREGIVHRDLKPDNVFLCTAKDGTPREPKVVDFGIAKLSGGDERLTRTGRIIGTPAYMAPEQLGGSREVDPRLDVYAIGALLFEMVSGRQAFPQKAIAELVGAITHVGAPPLRTVAPYASAGLEALVMRAMQRDRALRPRDADVLARELEALRPSPSRASEQAVRRALGEAATVPVTPPTAQATPRSRPAPAATTARVVRRSPAGAPTARVVVPRNHRGSRLAPALGLLALALAVVVAAGFALFVATRADVRSRAAPVARGAEASGPPIVELRGRSACRNVRFDPPLTVRHVGNRLDIISDRGHAVADVLSIDPGTRAQTGVFELSSQHAYHTNFSLQIVSAGMGHLNYLERLGREDPIAGTATVRHYNPRRGVLDLELRGVVLFNQQTGGLCLIDGRVRTFALTQP